MIIFLLGIILGHAVNVFPRVHQDEGYIKNALNKITLPSAVFLALIAIVPSIIFSFTGNHLIQAFGGTSILIMVGVVLDTVDKLEGQIKMYDYDGFFK